MKRIKFSIQIFHFFINILKIFNQILIINTIISYRKKDFFDISIQSIERTDSCFHIQTFFKVFELLVQPNNIWHY